MTQCGRHEVERNLQGGVRSQQNGALVVACQVEVVAVGDGRDELQGLLCGVLQLDHLLGPSGGRGVESVCQVCTAVRSSARPIGGMCVWGGGGRGREGGRGVVMFVLLGVCLCLCVYVCVCVRACVRACVCVCMRVYREKTHLPN